MSANGARHARKTPLDRARAVARRGEHTHREAQALTLELAAEHLAAARMHDWTGRARKVNGWGPAATELRRLARNIREYGTFEKPEG